MIRWTQKLEKTSSWKSLGVKLIRYDMEGHCGEIEFNTDDYWRCIIQHFVVSGLHPTSTCRMGSRRDPTAVVDPTLRYNYYIVKTSQLVYQSLYVLMLYTSLTLICFCLSVPNDGEYR